MSNSIVRRYQVERLKGTREVVRSRYVYDDDSHKTSHIEQDVCDEPAGYMVYFPAGHSVRIATEAELHRLGFNRIPGLVDQDTGDIIEPDRDIDDDNEDISPKSLVLKSVHTRRPKMEIEREE